MFGVDEIFYVFERGKHLFDQKYIKNCHTVKYYYN